MKNKKVRVPILHVDDWKYFLGYLLKVIVSVQFTNIDTVRARAAHTFFEIKRNCLNDGDD